MTLTAVLIAALAAAPGDAGALHITNLRATYGVGGPDRPDNKVLPGDTLVIAYDIEGMQPGGDGKLHYRIGMEVSDQQRTIQLKQDPKPKSVNATPDGRPLAGMATLHVGLDQPPGVYTVKFTVTDDTSRAQTHTSQNYEVLPKGFGLVRVTADGDPISKGIDPVFHVGKPGVVNFTLVGFGRTGTGGQPDVNVVMKVLGKNGPVLEQPTTAEVKAGVPAKALSIPMELRLELAKPGRYVVELTANDQLTGQRSTISLPITVSK